MTFRTRLAVLLVSTPLVAFAIVGGLLGKTVNNEESYQHLRVFEDVVSLISNNYVEDVDIDKVMEGAMRGLAEGLDAESSYLTPAEVSFYEKQAPPEAGQVGLDLTRQYYLRVVATREGSAAEKAGLRTGDYVREIDGEPTRRMSLFEGNRRLRGPIGSKLTITVLRGSATEPHTVTLIREAAPTEHVTVRQLPDGVAVVRVASLAGDVAASVSRRVDEARKGGANRLVLDLRSTVDGPFDNGVALARLFVPSGTLTQKEARGQKPESTTAASGDGAVTLPVALLVSTGTAGAAEIFAGALVENNRAVLVGEHTLGRAGLQKLVKFADGSGLLMTWARYLTPNGKPIHGTGLEPTERIDEPEVEFGEALPAGDPMLDAAVKALTTRKAA